MKNSIKLIALFCSTFLFSQVSTTRINDFKIGMKKSDLEKIIGKSIQIKLSDGYPSEPSNVVYKGIVYEVNFSKNYDENGNESKDYIIYSVASKDKTLKTLSGIGIGNTLYDVLDKYKDNNIEISDSWNDNGARSKTERNFTINDYDAGTYLHMSLKNGKVVGFYVGYNEGC